MTIIAIDYGEKRVGAAVGNSELKTAIPIQGMIRKKRGDDLKFISTLIEEYDPKLILIGHPLNMDGTDSFFSLKSEKFGEKIEKSFKIEIKMVDERLSSFEAEELLKDYSYGKKKKKKLIDSMSAMIILNRYLGDL